jgi:hypothetical protein
MFDLPIQSHQSYIVLAILKPLANRFAFDDNLLIGVGIAQIDDAVTTFVLIIGQIQVMAGCNHCLL